MLLAWNLTIYTLLYLVPFIEWFQLCVYIMCVCGGGRNPLMISFFERRVLHTHKSLEPSRPEGSLKAGVPFWEGSGSIGTILTLAAEI